jgi:hypothetical protein
VSAASAARLADEPRDDRPKLGSERLLQVFVSLTRTKRLFRRLLILRRFSHQLCSGVRGSSLALPTTTTHCFTPK